MIEKLLELFLHAKAGAISGVLLIGASGALVSATTQNGVTTINVTQASPTPSASASASPSPSASASPRPSVSPSPSAAPSLPAASPSATPTTTQQSAARAACVEATQTVDTAFHKHHVALAKLRSSDDHGTSAQTATAQTASKDAKLTVKKADELLKTIRKAAVKAIHETCKAHDDDEDDDEDKDKDEDDEDDEDKAPKSGLVLTGTPAEIAKQATAAMDLVMAAVRTTAQPTTSTKSGHDKDRDEQKSKDKGKSRKGGRD